MRILKCMSEVGHILHIVTGIVFALQYCCSESCLHRGAIRLQNGTNKFEGRVEVCGYRNSTNRTLIWKTVCNAGWDINEATVVCRQLGFSGDLDPIPITDGTFSGCSRHIDYIIKQHFTCQGDEEMLLNCSYYNRSSTYCFESQSRSAGVYCFGYDQGQKYCNYGDIRLSNGTIVNNASGRVEVCLGRLWGTVCDDGWDSNDANTVCRQLGYNHTKAIPTRGAYFGEGSGPIPFSRANCTSRDSNLTNCTINNTGVNRCNHGEDAGVICMGSNNCFDGDVKLIGGSNEREGHVEICYNGVWGTVCADRGWDEVDANITCQQLDITYQRALPISDSRFGDGEGPVLLESVTCSEGHLTLSQCVDSIFTGALGRCEHTAGVICMVEDIIMSTSTEKVPATTYYGTTTYMSHVTTATASGSTVVAAIVGAVGALFIMTVIAVIVIAILRFRKSKPNSHIQVDENVAYSKVPQNTVNMSRNEPGSFGMEENIAYGQVPQRCINTLRNEAYGALPRTGDYEDV